VTTPRRAKVKICGLTNYEDARLALELGADLLGFVLAASPRRVAPARAGAIVARLRDEGRLEGRGTVGVFVNESPRAMARAMEESGLDEAQLHGDESPEDCAALGFPWYRALRIGSAEDARSKVAAGWPCARLLVDALSASAYGGTGESIRAEAALAARDAARERGKEFFLAGGIASHNVFEVLRSIAPAGIDVSSGVEESPGRKSRERLERLFAEMRREAEEMERVVE
jgi:phosphoribosylanthranilate isomerase